MEGEVICYRTRDDLGTVAFGLRPRATVLKSFPAPRVNSFDCSLDYLITLKHILLKILLPPQW